MGINPDDIARVRDSTDIVALISQHLALKRVGSGWSGLCPFHNEKSPSFSVSAEKGFFHCFGCGKSGDAISFLQEIDHLDFVAAVELLAAKANITLRYDDRSQGEGRRERAKLVAVMVDAVQWYHERLMTAEDAGPARSYLRSRGIGGDMARRYQLGWAPDDWDLLARAFAKHGSQLDSAGLTFVNRRGRQQDFFRGRLLFPIFDAQGDPVSFGGRVMPGGDGPKYRNTAETPLYHKSRVLYGLNWAKADVVKADEVIICEGYTDVIGFAEAGITNAVATCGTALTEDHVVQLRKFARRLALAFDPDSAGKAAADRVYTWEHSHDIDVVVVDLPAGDDPADLARRDPAALRDAVGRAQPFLGYRVERVLAGGDLSTPEGRARTAESALAVISEHPSELVRDPYVMVVADRCRLDPQSLRVRLARGGFAKSERKGHREIPNSPERFDEPDEAVRRPAAAAVETEALRSAANDPATLLGLLDGCLFSDPTHRLAFEALEDAAGDLHRAASSASPEVATLLARVAVESTDVEALDVAALLVEHAGRRALIELERDSRQAPDPLVYAPTMSWLKLQLEALREDPANGLSSDGQLVAWFRLRDSERA